MKRVAEFRTPTIVKPPARNVGMGDEAAVSR